MTASLQTFFSITVLLFMSAGIEPPVEEALIDAKQDSSIYIMANSHTVLKLNENSNLYMKEGSESEITGSKSFNDLISLRINMLGGSLYFAVENDMMNNIEVITPIALASFNSGSAGFTSDGFYWVEKGDLDIMAMRSGQSISIRSGMFAQIDADGNDVVTGQLSADEVNQLRNEHSYPAGNTLIERFVLSFDADGKNVIRRENDREAEN